MTIEKLSNIFKIPNKFSFICVLFAPMEKILTRQSVFLKIKRINSDSQRELNSRETPKHICIRTAKRDRLIKSKASDQIF